MTPPPAAHATAPPPPPASQVLTTGARTRRTPTPRNLARRRLAVTIGKLLLPIASLILLASIALWPEFDLATDQARIAYRQVAGQIAGAHLTDAHYRGVDEAGRPYTLTASVAQQRGPDRVDLTNPKGDVTLQDGAWLMVQANRGVYLSQTSQLDLSQAVTLYRDDGTTLTTASASVDLKNGAAASAEPVHSEGPFGVLDAQGFTLLDKGAIVQFTGPATLHLNGGTP